MAASKRGDRVLGPYFRRGRWRIVVVVGGAREDCSFATKGEAEEAVVAQRRELERAATAPVDDAIQAYEDYLTDKGNKPRSVEVTARSLRRFFGRGAPEFDDLTWPISALTPEIGQQLYDELRARGYSADTHHRTLAEAKTFVRWCRDRGMVKRNHLKKVAVVGKKRKGKPQLRIEEARNWYEAALRMARDGKEGAVAALMALDLGMRCSEITSRVVRDLDDEGKLLWIPFAKTDAGRRTLEVSADLRPLLRRSARGKSPEMYLLGDGVQPHSREWVRRWVWAICDAAKVPRVSAHSMRGLHATLAVRAGATSHEVVRALGHESFAVTRGNYIQPGTVEDGERARVPSLVSGERHGPQRAEDDDAHTDAPSTPKKRPGQP